MSYLTNIRDPRSIEFRYKAELGKQLERYNGATRIDIFNNPRQNLHINSDIEWNQLITVFQQMQKEKGILPSFGLQIKYHSRKSFIVPFLLEFGKDNNYGLYFLIQKKPVDVPKIQQIERTINFVKLKGAFIVSNNIGNTARKEVSRINATYDRPILFLEHYGSIQNRWKMNIFTP